MSYDINYLTFCVMCNPVRRIEKLCNFKFFFTFLYTIAQKGTAYPRTPLYVIAHGCTKWRAHSNHLVLYKNIRYHIIFLEKKKFPRIHYNIVPLS